MLLVLLALLLVAYVRIDDALHYYRLLVVQIVMITSSLIIIFIRMVSAFIVYYCDIITLFDHNMHALPRSQTKAKENNHKCHAIIALE